MKEGGMNALEALLCRVQFRVLDLEYAFLDDEAVVALADMLEYYDSALRLNLSFNQHIGLRGWQALAKVHSFLPFPLASPLLASVRDEIVLTRSQAGLCRGLLKEWLVVNWGTGAI